jgi:hypothetical protein
VAIASVVAAFVWLKEAYRERVHAERESVARVRRALCTSEIGASAERIVENVVDRDVLVSKGHWTAMSPRLREEFAVWASVCRLDAAPIEIRLADGRGLVATYSRREGYADVF